LELDAADAQMFTTFTQVAFQMRPLCGIISDLLPLFGSRRHSWYFLSCGIAVLCQFLLMLCQKQNVNLIVVLLFAINLFGTVWVYVLTTAMIAEQAKKDKVSGAELLMAAQNFWFGVGMMLGDATAGWILEWMCGARYAWAFCMVAYSVLAFTPFLTPDLSAKPGSIVFKIQKMVANVTGAFKMLCGKSSGTDGTEQLANDSAKLSDAPLEAGEGADPNEPTPILELTGKAQMKLMWMTVNPQGPTKGVLLRAVVFIVFCLAALPDYYWGATYYFYHADLRVTKSSCPSEPLFQCYTYHNSTQGLDSWLNSSSGDGLPGTYLNHFVGEKFPDSSQLPLSVSKNATMMTWEMGAVANSGCSECALMPMNDCSRADHCEVVSVINRESCKHETKMQKKEDEECASTTKECHQKSVANCTVLAAEEFDKMEGLNTLRSFLHSDNVQKVVFAQDAFIESSASGYGYSGGYGYAGACDAETVTPPCEPVDKKRLFAVVDKAQGNITFCNYTHYNPCITFVGGLGFTDPFYSLLQTCGSLVMVLACAFYGKYLTKTPLRTIIVYLHIFLASCSIIDTCLALHLNRTIGISDKYFAFFDVCSYWIAIQLKMLPIYALCCRIAPVGVEATMVAIVYSLKDFGSSGAALYGAKVTTMLGVEANYCGVTDYENMYLLYIYRGFSRLLPVVFIYVCPTEKMIDEALERVEEYRRQELSDGSEAGTGTRVFNSAARTIAHGHSAEAPETLRV